MAESKLASPIKLHKQYRRANYFREYSKFHFKYKFLLKKFRGYGQPTNFFTTHELSQSLSGYFQLWSVFPMVGVKYLCKCDV